METSNNEHHLDFDVKVRAIKMLHPDHYFKMRDPRLQLTNIDLSFSFGIDIIVTNDIFDSVYGDGQAMTLRMSESVSKGCRLSLYVQNGVISMSNILLQPYDNING